MNEFLRIIMYIMTVLGVLMTVAFFISEIRLSENRFRWHYYLPSAALNIITGLSIPHLFILWLYMLSEGNMVMTALIPLLLLLVVAGCNFSFYFVFFRREDFSAPFYWSLSLTSLIVISYWTDKLLLLIR
ncbi:MAG: hypothetical protein IJU51_02435 [Clostridia bacterium]|nr:hypothetical protein [Clostridia bacterium]